MKITVEQIRDEISKGSIGAISLDTSVFKAQQLRLESGMLKRIEQFSGGKVKVVLSDVVVQEVSKHLCQDACEAQSSIKKALRGMNKSWQISKADCTALEQQLYGRETAESIAKKRLEDFLIRIDAETADSHKHVKVDELLDCYFSPKAPFSEKESKKHEFPDAIALLALESWAEQNKTSILIVSKDGDWKRYCEESKRLVIIEDLVGALNSFQEDAATYKANVLEEQMLLNDPLDITQQVSDAVNSQSYKIEFIPEGDSQFYFDVDDIHADPEFSAFIQGSDGKAFEVIDFDANHITVQSSVKVSSLVCTTFSFSKYDGIDKDYMGMGTGIVEVPIDVDIEVLLIFGVDDTGQNFLEEVELIPTGVSVNYGEIEPDWMNDSEYYEE